MNPYTSGQNVHACTAHAHAHVWMANAPTSRMATLRRRRRSWVCSSSQCLTVCCVAFSHSGPALLIVGRSEPMSGLEG